MSLHRWTPTLTTRPVTLPVRPIRDPQPSLRRVLREVAEQCADLSLKLNHSLDAVMTESNGDQLRGAGELLVWLDAIRDEARRLEGELAR